MGTLKKLLSTLAVVSVLYVSGQLANVAEAVAVNVGTYTVYTQSIKLQQGIYKVKIGYSDGKGTPMFIEFSKINGIWKHRDAVGQGAWLNVSDSKDMNDVLYVVLHSHEFE